jgi:myosin heavy subunit
LPLDNYPVQFTLYGAPAFIMNKSFKREFQWGIAVTYSFSRGEYLFEKRQQAIYRNWKLQEEVEGLKSGLSETQGKLTQTETDLEKTRGKLSETEYELNKITSELGSTRSKIRVLENTLSSTKGELETTKTTLDVVKTHLDTAKDELGRTQVRLNEKERELQQNQEALDKAKIIIQTALEGKEREEEEKKITQKQIQLDRELKRLSEEKLSLKKGNEQELKVRALWKDQCTKRRGIVNSEGECVCRVGETWDAEKNACICIKGYTLNKKTNICDPCPTVNISGSCVSKCAWDENRIAMKSGPHKFVCVKKCRGKNEIWIKSRNECGCIEGYNYDQFDKCVPRR